MVYNEAARNLVSGPVSKSSLRQQERHEVTDGGSAQFLASQLGRAGTR